MADLLSAWCQGSGTQPTCGNRALNPCFLETAAAGWAALAFLTAMCLNATRLRLAAAHRRAKTKERGPIGVSGGELGLICGTFFVAAIHAMHLAALLIYGTWAKAPYHLLFHSTMFAVWIGIEIAALHVSKVHVVLDLRPVLWSLLLVYIVSLETYWTLYRISDVFSLPYQRSTVWSLMLQTVMTLLLSVLDWKRRKPAAPAGYEALPTGPQPAGADVEAGTRKPGLTQPEPAAAATLAPAGSGTLPADPSQRMSWLSVFWDSCAAVWPENRWLQLRAVLAFLLLLVMRVLNLAVPILYKKLVDSMAEQTTADGGGAAQVMLIWGWLSPWVLAYLAAIFFQGGAGGGMVGAINNLRQVLWIPVGQDSYRRISLRIFTHVLGLDLNFHLNRKTGEVTKQIDRGTNAMQNILSTVLFSIVPTCIDVLTASTYLAQALEPSVALTVFLTVGSYIPVTIVITEWRGSLRREMNRTEQIQSARITDALLNYETVHYFTNEKHERDQYAKAIDDYQKAEYRSMASINVLNSVQSTIMWIGISIGLVVCTAGVHNGELTVGDVVLFLSLMAQLYGPLNWFGTYYRTIQQYTIDMENLFQLLEKQAQVQDTRGAKELVVTDGKVEYDRVWFQYEGRNPVLRDVTFTVPGGKTVAFVGATGSGKSTITRLIVRFYDVAAGAVRVDGVDVRDVTLHSLRRAIGVVPQDTVLFNDTILSNIRYGRLDATDEEVYAAAEAACIHEAITTRFPKGYQTMVGERGLRLSGGEKQRVAFARALLKNPQILVLDEATSALDTMTERKIQAALAASRAQRTTMIVAHRLSTIVDADIIVVLHLGEIKEMGSHPELLAKGGVYAELWQKQLRSGTGGDTALDSLLQGDASGSQTALARAAGSSVAGSSASLATLGDGIAGGDAKKEGAPTPDPGSGEKKKRGFFGRRKN